MNFFFHPISLIHCLSDLGGIVPNSDYGRRPHCFDTCHLNHGSLQRPSSPPLLSNQSSLNGTPSVQKFVEDLVTTPTCFDIQPFAEISFDPMLSSNTTNTSLSASSRMQRTSSSIIYTLMMLIFQSKFSWSKREEKPQPSFLPRISK